MMGDMDDQQRRVLTNLGRHARCAIDAASRALEPMKTSCTRRPRNTTARWRASMAGAMPMDEPSATVTADWTSSRKLRRIMTDAKRFHIGSILTITDGKVVSPDHVGGIYDLLGWMTGENLMTHQLPRASRECEGSLREQFPDLAKITVPAGLNTEEKVSDYLASLKAEYGTHRDVLPLSEDEHTHIDPIAEIHMIRPDAQIITIDAGAIKDVGDVAAKTAEVIATMTRNLPDIEIWTIGGDDAA